MKNSLVPYIILPEVLILSWNWRNFALTYNNQNKLFLGGVAALLVSTVGGVAVASIKAIEAEVAVLVAEDSNPVDQLEERKKLWNSKENTILIRPTKNLKKYLKSCR